MYVTIVKKGMITDMTVNFEEHNRVVLSGCTLFDLKKTFECGQCFRFDIDENGVWHGIVGDFIK
jgi:hypothetical protein